MYFYWELGGAATGMQTSGRVVLTKGYVYTVGTTRQTPFNADGTSKCLFLVGDWQYVRFSPGNLQAKTTYRTTWQFAPTQYDILEATGAANIAIGGVWYDLFGYGTSDWNSDESNTHLFQLRTNLDCGGGQILYYNNGNGFGYAVCTQCGKTIAETRRARHDNGPITDLPDGFYDDSGNHLMITSFRKNMEKCISLDDLQASPHKVQRNVILGGFITTDFTEIRVRWDKDSDWCDNDDSYKNFLTTLGILLSSCLAEYLGKENRDISFLITPNQHLCIFDTNPGGSGYSNKLGNIQNMSTIIDLALKKVESSSSKDDLLDKFTVKYIDYLDVDNVKSWLQSEINNREIVSDNIREAYPTATKSSFHEIELDILSSNHATIFVNDNLHITIVFL